MRSIRMTQSWGHQPYFTLDLVSFLYSKSCVVIFFLEKVFVQSYANSMSESVKNINVKYFCKFSILS